MANSNLDPIFAPDVVAQQQQLQQQQAIAQALMQQGMQDTGRTQMAGNVAIRNSPVAGLGNMLAAYLGGRMMNNSRQQQMQLARDSAARTANLFGAGTQTNVPSNTGDSSVTMPAASGPLSLPGSTSPQADLAAYATDPDAYIKKLLDVRYPNHALPPDQQIFQWLQTQPPEVQEAYAKYKQTQHSEAPYNTPIQTSSGFYSFNNRAGGVAPIVDASGKPLMPFAADPTAQRVVAQAGAEGKGIGEANTIPLKAKAEKLGEKEIEAQFNAPTALRLFDDFEKAVMRQPATAIGRAAERTAGVVGMGNQDQQNAIAEGETIASQLMAYANKLPGPASDKDRIDFKASIGAYADATATKAQRLAALRQARKSFQSLVDKYGNDAGAAQSAPPGASRFKVEVVQ